MIRRTIAILVLLAAAVSSLPVLPVAAAEYTLETAAAYDVRPDEGLIDVSVQMTFTNTTPDPEEQFSVFDEVKLAVHDAASAVSASDAGGELDVAVAVEDDVNVATVTLRDDLRFEESVDLELAYTLADGDDPELRVRPAVTVFPAWSFGTAGQVSIAVPGGHEVRVDGDELTEADGGLTSGPIEDPTQWLALVTVTQPAEYTTFDATVPLEGGTADLQVMAFVDDEAWGQRTLEIVEQALPLLEAQIGLPYPRVGGLVLIESVATDASGFAEAATTGTEILVAFDQPPFTALHQVAHVWLTAELVESRWIREGMASEVAGRVSAQLGVDPPFDPAVETTARADAAFPLDSWGPSADPTAEAYGQAAAWAFIAELEATVGAEALQDVLSRVASSIGPYAEREVDGEPAADGEAPRVPLTSRNLLDHLEAVTDADLAELFGGRVFTEADVELLPARSDARDALSRLQADAEGWGAPDPVRAAMAAWRFDEAMVLMDDAATWLEARDQLVAGMADAGLSAPDRLLQAYRSFGGGAEAQLELDAERAVVEAYAATAADLNSPRSFMERIGLIGGLDPSEQLRLANGRFADGDLRGSADAVGEARRLLASAETGGIVRLISSALLIGIVAVLAVFLFRRRAAYTASP